MKKYISILVLIFFIVCTCFLYLAYIKFDVKFKNQIYIPAQQKTKWVTIEPNYNSDFYKTRQAQRIGDNLLIYQNDDGGWPKNLYLQNKLNFLDKIYVIALKSYAEYDKKNVNFDTYRSTIDNWATTTEIDYLAKLYNAMHKNAYKKAVIKGINYICDLQYENGGFPQKISETTPYANYITYNDMATVNVLFLFTKILKDKQYSFVDSEIKVKVENSYNKAIECILKTQLSSGLWAAQYEPKTLTPVKARSYEPASGDSRESADILIFLMDIENPTPEIKNAIEKSIKWFENNKIKNKKIVYYVNAHGQKDLKIQSCDDCEPIWGRMYDLSKNVPIFSDRTEKIVYDLQEIQYERRIGYDWYTTNGNLALKKYKVWKNKNNK